MGASFGENDHGIDAGEGGENLGALLLWDERTAGAFELVNRFVAIEADDEEVPEFLRALQVANMPEVKQIETPVRGHDLLAATARAGGPTRGLRQG